MATRQRPTSKALFSGFLWTSELQAERMKSYYTGTGDVTRSKLASTWESKPLYCRIIVPTIFQPKNLNEDFVCIGVVPPWLVTLRPQRLNHSRGSNSNSGKMDQTWSTKFLQCIAVPVLLPLTSTHPSSLTRRCRSRHHFYPIMLLKFLLITDNLSHTSRADRCGL